MLLTLVKEKRHEYLVEIIIQKYYFNRHLIIFAELHKKNDSDLMHSLNKNGYFFVNIKYNDIDNSKAYRI